MIPINFIEPCRNRITTGRSQTYLFFQMFKLIMESPL